MFSLVTVWNHTCPGKLIELIGFYMNSGSIPCFKLKEGFLV